MVSVYFSDSFQETDEVALNDGESVLSGLLRAGHPIPNGCQAGACQSCLMISAEPVPAKAQAGLSAAQKELGFFLSCCCEPTQDMQVSLSPDSSALTPVTVLEKTPLNEQILRLRLAPETPIAYQPGQFITLNNNQGDGRCYSLASHPDEPYLELHIKLIEGGRLSQYLWHEINPGDPLTLQNPAGLCFYTAHQLQQPLLLCGIGTGLAPLYGIVKDALQQGHSGPITLVVGSQQASQLYLFDELNALAAKHANLSVHFVAQTLDIEAPQVTQADIYQTVKELLPSTTGQRVFLCGAESFVKKMKRQVFMAGAQMADISADPFISTGKAEAPAAEAVASSV